MGNVLELQEEGFRIGNRKLFTQRVVRQWNRLPREAVDARSLKYSSQITWCTVQPRLVNGVPDHGGKTETG